MAADSGQKHRTGPLKQQNKTHKHGKHRSKGELERENKGRVNVKSFTRKAVGVKKKADRRNQAAELRKQKREEAMSKKRSIGAAGSPPHTVAVVSLHADVSVAGVVEGLTKCDDTATVVTTGNGIVHMSVPRFKQRVEFVMTEYGRLYEVLDVAKAADSLLLVVSAEDGVDSFGDCCLACLYGQGQLASTLITQGMKTIPQKKQKEARKHLQKKLEKWFPHDKVHSVDTAQESVLVLRHVLEQKLKTIHYRELRPYVLAHDVKYEIEDTQDTEGILKLTGYVRSQTMSVNRLVHLPGWGEFQLSQIDVLEDPHPLFPRNSRRKLPQSEDVEMGCDGMASEAVTVERPDPALQEALESEVIPDPMEGEQTWPTEEELAEADAQEKTVRRVPKGTSEYQASWIVDDVPEAEVGEPDDDLDDMEDEDMEAFDEEDSEDDLSDSDNAEEEEEEYENLSVQDDKDKRYDEQMDMEEEQQMLARLREERSHVQFPDEVDTPQGSNARTRFQRYRGLKSFRTSPWDPRENLPQDYARIFQFHNFRQTANIVRREEMDPEGAVAAWSYVRLHIDKVPRAFMDDHRESSPVVVFGLLPHEQKMSVVNLVVRKCSDVRQPIRSKERLTFHVGFRRFSACPVFSQHTTGNKHKMERYLPADTAVVATMFAPITFPPAPVLVFQDRPFGELELVAKGSLLSVNPDRIITKRAVLSGAPLKINKKSCVVRYMFFNREDIDWFKPVELRTKWGRRGHIKEPLGTHGHMKCVFDGHLKSQDTVLLNLYKRMFPKWTYSARVSKPGKIKVSKSVSMATIREDDEEKQEKMEEGTAFALFD